MPRLPTAVLAMGLVLLSFLSFACGLILDTVTRGRRRRSGSPIWPIPAPDFEGGDRDEPARLSAAAAHRRRRRPARPDYDADVIILALDRAEDTVAAIASARAQAGIAKHVWIADQGSRPENLALLAAAVTGAADATLVQLDRQLGRRRRPQPGNRARAPGAASSRSTTTPNSPARTRWPRRSRALEAEPDLAAIACRILVFATGADDLSSWGYPPALLPRAAESFDAVTFVGAGHAIRRADFDGGGRL